MKNKNIWIIIISAIITFIILLLLIIFVANKIQKSKNVISATNAYNDILVYSSIVNLCKKEGVDMLNFKQEYDIAFYNSKNNLEKYIKEKTQKTVNDNSYDKVEAEAFFIGGYAEYKRDEIKASRQDYCNFMKDNHAVFVNVIVTMFKEDYPQWYVK